MVPREHDSFRSNRNDRGFGVGPEANGAMVARAGGDFLLAYEPASRRSGWTYLSNAAIHPSNLLLLIGVMFLSLILWSGPVLLCGIGVEAAFLVVVPRCAFFRRSVDACLDEAERAAAQKAREVLILQMSEGHRQELCKLEALIGKTFANVQRRALGLGAGPSVTGATIFAAADPLGMSRLTHSYIRLAIAHRACEESLATTNRHVIEGTIRSLEAAESALDAAGTEVLPASATSSPALRSRKLLQRRLSIAYRRAACWTRTRETLEAIGHQLATVTELVHLLHQESLAPPGSSGVSAEVDRVLADFEHGEGALRELADIGLEEAALEVHELSGEDAALVRRV
jgi:hypothetical protein